MLAGTGRWSTTAIEVGEGQFAVKTGAEGVCCGIVPSLGLGIALKIDDGAARAAEAVMSELLVRFAGLEEHKPPLIETSEERGLLHARGRALKHLHGEESILSVRTQRASAAAPRRPCCRNSGANLVSINAADWKAVYWSCCSIFTSSSVRKTRGFTYDAPP